MTVDSEIQLSWVQTVQLNLSCECVSERRATRRELYFKRTTLARPQASFYSVTVQPVLWVDVWRLIQAYTHSYGSVVPVSLINLTILCRADRSCQAAVGHSQDAAETQPHTAGAACAQNTLNKSCHLVHGGSTFILSVLTEISDGVQTQQSSACKSRWLDFLTPVLSNLSQSETSSKLFLNSESWKGLKPFGSSPVLSVKHNDLTLRYWLCICRSAKCSESRPRHQAQIEKIQQGNPFLLFYPFL